MARAARWLGILFGIVSAASAAAQPLREPTRPVLPVSASTLAVPASAESPNPPQRIVLSEVVNPAYREAVLAVARKPTLTTRGLSDDVACSPAVYEWLLDHPDRVSLAWRRLKVPCVEITDAGQGRFMWADGEGSELSWRVVGRFPGGLVWYATGKVKASQLVPTVPVKAVVVMTHPKQLATDGPPAIRPAAQVFLQTDSRAASMVMRLLGPTAPKMAQDGVEQLLYFFTGVSRYVQSHPEKAEAILAPAK